MTTDGYGFSEELPIDPIPPGSTILVAGPALSRAEDLALSMVADGTESPTDEGMLFISTNMTCRKLLDLCEESRSTFDRSRAVVIDCSGQELGEFQSNAQIKSVSTQSDLTGIGMKFSALYESMYAAAEGGRV